MPITGLRLRSLVNLHALTEMKLTSEDQAYVAQRACWYFDCQTAPRTLTALPDNVVFTGQGLSDLNRTIGFLNFNPTTRIICEVGSNGTVPVGVTFPNYKQCDIQDIYAIKDAYIAYYGSVDRPDVYVAPFGGAIQVETQT